jgi:hypothetical protein
MLRFLVLVKTNMLCILKVREYCERGVKARIFELNIKNLTRFQPGWSHFKLL